MTLDSDTLLSDLQALAGELGRAPTFREYDDRGAYGACTIQRRFGSWNDALRAAGLDPTHEPGIADEALLADLERVASELGETPQVTDYADRGEFGASTLQERFGSWNAALRAAGLNIRRETKITREDVGKDISRVASDLQRAPTAREYADQGRYAVSTAFDRFESWSDAQAFHSDLCEGVDGAETVTDVAEALRISRARARRRLSAAGLLGEVLTAEEIIERAATAGGSGLVAGPGESNAD